MADSKLQAIAEEVAAAARADLNAKLRAAYGYDFAGEPRHGDAILAGVFNAISSGGSNISLDAALAFAARACAQQPDSPARKAAIGWLDSIREQRGCEGWRHVDVEEDGSFTVGRSESARLVDLISVIIRG